MLRPSVLALFVTGLCTGVARPDGKDDLLQKELANLKGDWLSAPMKDGNKEFQRLLRLGKGEAPVALRQPGNTVEQFKELTQLSLVVEKDKNRYLKFVGLLLSNEFLVEYELAGDKLKLKGSAGGLEISGEYTRRKVQENEKKGPAAERIADQLATYVVLEKSFGKKVKNFVIGRIATYDEPLELKFAHCLLIAYPNIDKIPEQLRLVKAQLALDTAILQELVKDDKYAGLLIKSRSLTLAAENKAELRKTFDDWEINYAKSFNPESAAALGKWSSTIKSEFPKELLEARTRLKEQLRTLLAADPEAAKTLTDALKPTEDIQKARAKMKMLIEEMRKK